MIRDRESKKTMKAPSGKQKRIAFPAAVSTVQRSPRTAVKIGFVGKSDWLTASFLEKAPK